jgi:hypothetical protein
MALEFTWYPSDVRGPTSESTSGSLRSTSRPEQNKHFDIIDGEGILVGLGLIVAGC